MIKTYSRVILSHRLKDGRSTRGQCSSWWRRGGRTRKERRGWREWRWGCMWCQIGNKDNIRNHSHLVKKNEHLELTQFDWSHCHQDEVRLREEEERRRIVEEERKRILQQNAERLIGHIPKGVLSQVLLLNFCYRELHDVQFKKELFVICSLCCRLMWRCWVEGWRQSTARNQLIL